MDTSIFIVLAILIFVVSLTVGIRYMRAKGYVDATDITIVMAIFGLSMEFADELNLKNEEKIFNIMEIIYSVLLHFSSTISVDPVIVKEEIKLTANKLVAEQIGLTPSRERIINSFIELAFQIGIDKVMADIDKKYLSKVVTSE